MACFKNCPEGPANLADQISIKPQRVISKALCNLENCSIRLFSLDDDEEITQEIYPMDTMYLVLEGKLIITKEGKKNCLSSGDFLMLPMGVGHSLNSVGPCKYMEIKVKE